MPLIPAAVPAALGNLLGQDRDVGWDGGSSHCSGEQEEARNLLQQHQDMLAWSLWRSSFFSLLLQ